MKFSFRKMQGCGNDYIYTDVFDTSVPNPAKAAVILSDRHYGIGGDGLVLIGRSVIADASMRMFNSDGSEGAMCGNAIRCVAKHLYESGRVAKENMNIETACGVKSLRLTVAGGLVKKVRVDMGAAVLDPARIPVLLEGERIVNRGVSIAGSIYNITCISMGNPHCIVFVNDPDALNLIKTGPLFENAPIFPSRVNTEFVRVISNVELQMRVWERGSGETLACGTGACAAAASAVLCGFCRAESDISVKLRGGVLTVNYSDKNITLEGDAADVFEGVCDLEV